MSPGSRAAVLTRLRLSIATLPGGDWPFPGYWLLLLAVACVLGVIVSLTPSVGFLAGITLLSSGWIIAAMAHRATQYAVAFNVLLALVLPDVLGNVASSQFLVLLLAANVGVLVLAGVRGPVEREDVGVLFLLGAVLWPYLVGGPIDTLPGAVAIIVIVYATGRLRGVSLRSFVTLLLLAGAVHGAVAIAQSIPALSSLVPFQPLRDGLPFVTGRASGLFNNPNTLGTVESVVIVFAIRVGVDRRALWLVALCAAGLLLSSSREAVFGLVLGLSLFGVGRPRQMVVWAVIFVIVGAIVVSAFPSLLDRLDPRGFGADPNLLGRFDAWREALDLIHWSPLVGYGPEFGGLPFVDNAYLQLLVIGGATGLALWSVGTALATPRLLWPVLAAMLAIAVLANPFAGPAYAVFLSACGAVTAENAWQRRRATDGSLSRSVHPMDPTPTASHRQSWEPSDP